MSDVKKSIRYTVWAVALSMGILMGLVLTHGCASSPAPTPPVVDKPIHTLPVPNPPEEKPTTPANYDAAIDAIVAASPCLKYSFSGKRGLAPSGYVQGLAKTYARSMCRYMSPDKTPAGVMGQALGPVKADVLTLYKLDGEKGSDRIRNLYAFMVGLGMRESSGWYGEGRDMHAGYTASNTAETGLFQFSYNMKDGVSANGKAQLAALYAEYKAHPEKCMQDTFERGKGKGRVINETYWSLPSENAAAREEGLAFQKFARHCPAFATEYTAVGLRERLPHWGPAKRSEAEFVPACQAMLLKVDTAYKCE